MDEERMRSDLWLGSVVWVSFSVLTLTVGWQDVQPACNSMLRYPQKFCF